MSPVESEPSSAPVPALNELTVTIVHDNNPGVESLKMAWGFSALVTGPDKTILFDTGSDGSLLLENMTRLQIDPGRIDIVVLSHVHKDHTGGLTGLLQANPRVQVFLPQSFRPGSRRPCAEYGATVVEIAGPQEICRNVYTTGVLGRRVKEQALVFRTQPGLVVLTGCAHPGIAPDSQADQGACMREVYSSSQAAFISNGSRKGRVETIIAAFRTLRRALCGPDALFQ